MREQELSEPEQVITNTNGAALLIQALQEQGVTTVFGYPGGAIMPTYDALFSVQDQLHHVLVRHEQGAIHAAQGYARAAGTVGVCLSTSGPGATNLITGLADALMDSTPLVCITGQVNSAFLGTDAFQEADVLGLTLSATKWSYQVADAREIPAVLQQAFIIARSGRPGPVVIDIPKDVQSQPLLPADAPYAVTGIHHAHYRNWAHQCGELQSAELQRAAELMNTAEKPMLLVGQGVSLAQAETQVMALAETAGIPVAATLHGLSVMPCDHPLYVGMLGMHGHYGANRLTDEADVIVGIGLRFDDRVTGAAQRYAPQAKVIHIEIDPAELGRHVSVTVGLVGDARDVVERLQPLIEERRHTDWLRRFRACDTEEYQQVGRGETEPTTGPLRMGEVIRRLSAATHGEALIVSDVGQHQMVTAHYYQFAHRRSHITSGSAGTMGFALPAALGAKLAAPERDVIAVIGDGGFQMTLQELGTVAQCGVPLKIIILNNGYLGMVRQWQEMFHDERYSHVQLPQPDFVQVCGAYGIGAQRVEQREQLDPAINRLLKAESPWLLDIAVAPMANVFPMVAPGSSAGEIRLQ